MLSMLLLGGGLILLASAVISRLLRQQVSLKHKHVLITGGSSGIGKCVAVEVAKLGANVTLFARDEEKLQKAKLEVEASFINKNEQKVNVISVDIGGNYEDVETAVRQAEDELGPVGVLVNCAGFAIAAKLEDTNAKDIRRLMDVNYVGSIFVVKAVLPSMKAAQWGRIVFTSSQAGLLGVYGYTAYAASKFALRGLAETLQMEVKPYNIRVMLAFPPDTDTPGFAEEEKTKPLETRIISETSGLILPDVVAKSMVTDMMNGKFTSAVGRDGTILKVVCAGMSPVTSISEMLIQVTFMGIFRIVGVALLYSFDKTVASCKQKRDQAKKSS